MRTLMLALACFISVCYGFSSTSDTLNSGGVPPKSTLRSIVAPLFLQSTARAAETKPLKAFAMLLLARAGWRLTRGQQRHIFSRIHRPSLRADASVVGSRAVAAPGGVGLFNEGQNLDELFDLLQEPPSIGVLDPASVKYAGTTKPRGEIHRDGDWHRSIHLWVVVRRSDGSLEAIFQKRALTKDTHPGLWDVSVAGHIDAGAQSLETVVRETEEEIGVVISETQVKHLFTMAAEARGETKKHGRFWCREVQDVYLLELSETEAEAVRYSTGEVAELRSLPLDESIAVLRASDANYVPRTPAYIEALTQGLGEAYPDLGIE